MSKSVQKISGVYPGNLRNPDEVKNMNEVDLFLLIDYYIDYIAREAHIVNTFHINIDLSELVYALDYLVYHTKKFGIDIKNPIAGEHIEPSEDFYVWYNFYKNHFEETLAPEVYDDFITLYYQGADVSYYLPEGSWKDNLPQQRS